MSLTLVPTPLGNKDDFTLRGVQILRDADLIIVEEFKESSQWLRSQQITGKPMEKLNEHTTDEEVSLLAKICAEKKVALISDSGTPGFCDPGPRLIRQCRKNKTAVHSLPGASSLMLLLSYSSVRIEQFLFRGFLPAENEARKKAWLDLKKINVPMILMDTPYRLQKFFGELQEHFPGHMILFGANLTCENEFVGEGTIADISCEFEKKVGEKKAEFILILFPTFAERP